VKIGYARVSTLDQNTAMQLAALRSAECDVIFEEKRSAVKARPEFDRALQALSSGDVLVVYKLDRLARSLSHLLSVLEHLKAKGAGLRSLTEPIDTSSPAGLFTVQVLGAAAQFERALIRERSIAGQVEAIRRGIRIGGRDKLLDGRAIAAMKKAHDRHGLSWAELGRRWGVSNTTARRYVLGDNRERMQVLRQYL